MTDLTPARRAPDRQLWRSRWTDASPPDNASRVASDETSEGGDDLVMLAQRFRAMTSDERRREARRPDLTQNEQLALATFADDGEIADALLASPTASDAALGVARSLARSTRPRWQRIFRR
jgi:hypothetical protein